MPVNLQHLQHAENATKTEKNIFNRIVWCQKLKKNSMRLEIRNQHVEMNQIPPMEEKSATSSAKPVSLMYGVGQHNRESYLCPNYGFV